MAKTRAIRISDEEDKLIREFLAKNNVLDFSTLARVAIKQFIENPSIELKSVGSAEVNKIPTKKVNYAEPRN